MPIVYTDSLNLNLRLVFLQSVISKSYSQVNQETIEGLFGLKQMFLHFFHKDPKN